jgi:DNA polymerase-3 subunit epsilon
MAKRDAKGQAARAPYAQSAPRWPPMKVCFFDFETNGLDPKVNLPTEVGALKFEYNEKFETDRWQPLSEFSSFIWDETYPAQTEKIVELTGITDAMLKSEGRAPGIVFPELLNFLEDVDLIVAHQADFDIAFLSEACKKLGLKVPQIEVLCTKTNFDWPEKYFCHRLTHLALEHFIEFKMRDMHRATADCGLLQKLVSLYDFDKALAYAREPWVVVMGKVTKPWEDGGKSKDAATKLGFSWERLRSLPGPVFAGKWVARVKQSRLAKLTENAPFAVHVIENF